MRDLDWLNAMYLGCFGFAIGPFIGFALFQLEMNFGHGINNPHSPFALVFSPFVVVFFGTLAGSIIGFLWGLLGEQIRDGLYEASTFLARKIRRRKSRRKADPLADLALPVPEAVDSAFSSPSSPLRETIPLVDMESGVMPAEPLFSEVVSAEHPPVGDDHSCTASTG